MKNNSARNKKIKKNSKIIFLRRVGCNSNDKKSLLFVIFFKIIQDKTSLLTDFDEIRNHSFLHKINESK